MSWPPPSSERCSRRLRTKRCGGWVFRCYGLAMAFCTRCGKTWKLNPKKE